MSRVRNRDLERLNYLCRNIYKIKDSGVADAATRIDVDATKILGILSRGTLQNALADEPPTTMPFSEFVANDTLNARADLIGKALSCAGFLCNLTSVIHRDDVCPFDAGFFLRAFAWLDYLTPASCLADLASASASAHLRTFYVLTFSHICISFLQGFTQYLPQERVRSVMLSGDERATAVMVRLWMSWPKILGLLHAAQDPEQKKTITFGSLLLLASHYKAVEADDILRKRVVDNILLSVNNQPRRFFHVFAKHIRYTITHTFVDDEERFMGDLFRALIVFSQEAGLGMPGRLPRKLLVAVMDCLRHHIRLTPSSTIWKVAWGCLAGMCLRDTRTFYRTIELNLLGTMVAIRITAPETPLLPRMYRMLNGISDTIPAVRAFHASRSRPGVSRELALYDAQEVSIVKTYKYHHTVLADSEVSWRRIATCCNGACPWKDEERNARALRACACGEALYCSKICQRAHWTVGGHNVECSSRHELDFGVLSSRDMNRLVSEARVVLQKLFDGFLAEPYDPGYAVRVVIDTRLRQDGWPSFEVHKVISESRTDESPYVIVDVVFLQAEIPRVRRLRFLPERYAGRVPQPYRLLSQAFFDGLENEEPPRLHDLTQRERLFGRRNAFAALMSPDDEM